MINEIEEFEAYTRFPDYTVKSKYDRSYLGCFTVQMFRRFQGFAHILTILARGYMWKTEVPDIDRARRALCAWCSIYERPKKKRPDWKAKTWFPELHEEFPELVDQDGRGWFPQHVDHIVEAVKANAAKIPNEVYDMALVLGSAKFEKTWQNKVRQFQIPLGSENTKGAWVLRFDDVLATALEEGPLKANDHIQLTERQMEFLAQNTPKGLPGHVLPLLAKFYLANRSEDSEWVILPQQNLDAYFGKTTFTKRWLSLIPKEVMERENRAGVCRFKMMLPDDGTGANDADDSKIALTGE